MSLLDHYKVLGLSAGAGMADVAASYKRLCRIHHPDVNADPASEEIMKKINIAYTALREKFKREAAFRERAQYSRPARRYGSPDSRAQSAETRRPSAESEKAAYAVLHGYFKAINSFDFAGAYSYLSSYDKRHITRDSFIEWRKSVARLYPMREFKITGGLPVATINWGEEKILYALRFRVAVTEETFPDSETRAGNIQAGDVEKLVIEENGAWKVFLGYMSVRELTRTFEERLENKRKRDIAKRWDEYYTGLYPEYNMLSLTGMHKAASRELYRQKRYGGAITFAAMSVKNSSVKSAGQEQLLRSAAKTIRSSLRQTDCSAYAGDCVFALLMVELRKKNAADIIRRLTERIRKDAGPQLGAKADIEYEFKSWSGNALADIEAMNKVLLKFRKKM